MDVTTIVFALLAIFVVWKLRSVLGTRTGNEQPPLETFRRNAPEPQPDDGARTILRFPGGGAEPEREAATPDRRAAWLRIPGVEEKVVTGLEAIASADPTFEPKSFIEGAKTAYEMIIMSYAAGNRPALQDLLSKDVFESFAAAIAEREQRGETVDTTFVSIDRTTIEDAQLRPPTAQVSLRFQSKLITATRDRSGVIIEGNGDKVVDMVDVWTFARDTTSRDPNWRLVATEAGA
ncbi:MAG: calcium-binding protein [Hyphomicrobiales bacterium]|jgi:predicted lipid-binding transport protein (Tim44 family)|nr:calcium-binding protein [Hyphomicrobiales bacterium]